MSSHYRAVDWNRQKKRYDFALALILAIGIGVFLGVGVWVSPESTAETLILRTTSISAFFLLHVILCIGPLARLDRRFLPLLYNRRHLGVTLFSLALIHGALAIFQFHALGDENPLVSVFTAYQRDYTVWSDGRANIAHFPFEPFGFAALLCLFILAALSHDFWLHQLGASLWKTCHLLVYPAYLLLVAHVAFGVVQTERSWLYPGCLGAGFALVAGLHLAAALRESRIGAQKPSQATDGFVWAGSALGLAEGRARVVKVGGQRLALVRHQDRLFVTSNVCRHQGGPLGEGRVVNDCLTCPWHGWNYLPEDGCSPPPFEERVATFAVRVVAGEVWIHPDALPLGTRHLGALILGEGAATT